MAIQGGYYFTAQNGTVTSPVALANPYHPLITLDSSAFIKHSILSHTITDTHFDNPDRKGRLMAFLARIKTDDGINGRAIACDEYTAVCIDANGIARVFGGHPTYDDNAYFIQTNCELANTTPENCTPGNPLTWHLNGQATTVYQIKGNASGNNSFDLKNWQQGTNGNWFHWSVLNGEWMSQTGTAIDCAALSVSTPDTPEIQLYPNPATDSLMVTFKIPIPIGTEIALYNAFGQQVAVPSNIQNNYIHLTTSTLPRGWYYLTLHFPDGRYFQFKISKA
jgi:hypothetical protein